MDVLFKKYTEADPEKSADSSPGPNSNRRGPKRKSPDQGVRRLAVDVPIEIWQFLKTESSRTGKPIKELLSDCVVTHFSGQANRQVKKQVKAAAVRRQPSPEDKVGDHREWVAKILFKL